MSNVLEQLVEEAIKLELNMAELYIGFHIRFPEDSGFWRVLSYEEKGHASMIMNSKQVLLNSVLFPSEIIEESLQNLVYINCAMESITRRLTKYPPMERTLAFKLAIELEELAEGIHFQSAIKKTEHTSEALELLQRLNKDDKDHADRIRSYMSKSGIN